MKMNNIYTFLVLLLIVTACNNDFLDLKGTKSDNSG